MTDLPGAASLNEAERRVLAMLAEGHTAKTIAVVLGTSVHAVNERLREARRKTGAASSRELARALAAQENRDDKIGVATTRPVEERDLPPSHGATVGLRKGLRPMTVLISLGLAGVLLAGVMTQSGQTARDPLLGDLVVAKGGQPGDLYRKVRGETRDAIWAGESEAALLNRFGAVPGIAKLRVTCGATLCEVAGALRPGSASGAALLAVQEIALRGLRDLGFADVASLAAGGEGAGDGAPFVAYPVRLPADVPHVVATVPVAGARIAPGPYVLSVTFDRAMRPGSFSFVTRGQGAYPDCDGRPRQSADGRTFSMTCTARPDTIYAIGFNAPRFRNFVSATDDVAAEPAMLWFQSGR